MANRHARKAEAAPKHVKNWIEGLENHKRLMEILPFMKELDEGYL